jgi:hypothetical protein
MPEKTAFSERRFTFLDNELTRLKDLSLAHHSPFPDFTQDDFLMLVMKPEHRDVLVEAQKVVGDLQVHTQYTTLWQPQGVTNTADAVKLGFTFKPPLKMLMPAYCAKGVLRRAPPDLFNQVAAWVERRLQIGRDFAITRATLKMLNERCASPDNIRFMLPAMLCLLPEELEGVRRALERAKVPPKFPALPEGAKDGIRTAQETLAKAVLLPNSIPHGYPIYLDLSDRGYIDLPWKGHPIKVAIE